MSGLVIMAGGIGGAFFGLALSAGIDSFIFDKSTRYLKGKTGCSNLLARTAGSALRTFGSLFTAGGSGYAALNYVCNASRLNGCDEAGTFRGAILGTLGIASIIVGHSLIKLGSHQDTGTFLRIQQQDSANQSRRDRLAAIRAQMYNIERE